MINKMLSLMILAGNEGNGKYIRRVFSAMITTFIARMNHQKSILLFKKSIVMIFEFFLLNLRTCYELDEWVS